MGLLDLEALKRRGQLHQIAEFSSYRKPVYRTRLYYSLIFGGKPEYMVTVQGKEVLVTEDFTEAVDFYNAKYLEIRG